MEQTVNPKHLLLEQFGGSSDEKIHLIKVAIFPYRNLQVLVANAIINRLRLNFDNLEGAYVITLITKFSDLFSNIPFYVKLLSFMFCDFGLFQNTPSQC